MPGGCQTLFGDAPGFGGGDQISRLLTLPRTRVAEQQVVRHIATAGQHLVCLLECHYCIGRRLGLQVVGITQKRPTFTIARSQLDALFKGGDRLIEPLLFFRSLWATLSQQSELDLAKENL